MRHLQKSERWQLLQKDRKAQRIHIAKKIEKSKVWKLTNIVRMTESLLIIAIQRDLIENLKQYIRQYLA